MASAKGAQTLKVSSTSPQRHGSPFLEVPRGSVARASQDTTYSELSILSTEPAGGGGIFLDGNEASASAGRHHSLNVFWLRHKGAVFILAAQLFSACMNVATKILESPSNDGPAMHPLQLLFVRMVATTFLSLIYMWYAHVPHSPFGSKDVRPLLILRGFSGFFGVTGLYFSLLYLPISEAVVLTFLAPMLSCYIYSFLQPDEPFTRIQQLGAYISIVGVVFIARPDSLFSSSPPPSATVGPTLSSNTTTSIDTTPHNAPLSEPPTPTTSQHLYAIALAMMGVVGGAIAVTTVRYIGKRAHPLISITYFSIWSTFVSGLSSAFIPGVGFRLPHNLTEWGLLLFVGINGFVMQVFLTMGLAYSTDNDPAKMRSTSSATAASSKPRTNNNNNPAGKSGGSRATTMMYTQMLFALLFDKIFWGLSPNLWSWIGGGFILGSIIWVSIRDEKDNNKDGLRTSTQRVVEEQEEEEQEPMLVGRRDDSLGDNNNNNTDDDDDDDNHDNDATANGPRQSPSSSIDQDPQEGMEMNTITIQKEEQKEEKANTSKLP